MSILVPIILRSNFKKKELDPILTLLAGKFKLKDGMSKILRA